MSANLMLGFQGVLLIFMLIGLLMGIWRGFNKSLIRLFIVIAMSIICFFITPPIANAIANADFNITVDGIQVNSIKEAIVTLLEKVGFINEIMLASPTFKAFVEAVPAMLINLLFFMAGFFVLTIISMLFSWLLSKAILHRVPKEKRSRFRLLGGIIGALQGVFVFAVMAVPVFGLISTADKALTEIDKNTPPPKEQLASTNQIQPEYTLTTTTDEENILDQINTDKYNEYISDFNKLPVVKVFKALGIKSLQEKVYNNLATMTIKKEKVRFEDEVLLIAKVSPRLESITKFTPSSTKEDYDNMRFVVDNLFDSKLFSRISEEIVRYTATEWSDEKTPIAFGVTKPDLGNLGNPLLDKALLELQNSTRITLETDLLQMVSAIECLNKNGIYEAFTNNSSSEELMRLLAKDDGKALEELIDVMIPSSTLTAILPQLVQTGLDTVYPTLNILKDNIAKETKILEGLLLEIQNAYKFDNSEIENKDAIASSIRNYMNKYNFNLTFNDHSSATELFEDVLVDLVEELYFNISTLSTAELKSILDDNKIYYNGNATNDEYITLLQMNRWDLVTQEQLQIKNQITPEEWKIEKTLLSSIFSNLIKAYDSVKGVETGKEFESMDFAALGKVFDGMRHSILLDDEKAIPKPVEERVAFNIVKAMLQSDLMKNINVTNSFINTIKQNWDDDNFKFEEAFKTLGSTVQILDKFNKGENISAENVKDLLNGLTGSGGTMIKDILKDEIISSGADKAVTDAISDIVDELANQNIADMTDEDWKKEADAFTSTLNILEQTNSNGHLNNLTDNQITDVVDNLLDSKVLYGSLKAATENNESLNQKVKDAASGSSSLLNAINAKQNEIENSGAENTADQLQKLDNLRNLFGL